MLAFVLLIFNGVSQTALPDSGSTPVISLPREAITRIPSPSEKWSLIFKAPDVYSAGKLWIQEKGAIERTLVRDFNRSLGISWSPDSRHFFVNDASGSTDTQAYVYDPVSLKATALADVVVAADPNAKKYLGAGHSYLEANRWITSRKLLVTLWGHFDEERIGFKIKYRVDLNGRIQRVYKREYR